MVGFGASTNLQHPTFCREVYFAQTFDFYLILAVLVSTSGAQRLHTATANNIKKDTMRLKCSKEIEHYRRLLTTAKIPAKHAFPTKWPLKVNKMIPYKMNGHNPPKISNYILRLLPTKWLPKWAFRPSKLVHATKWLATGK